MHRRHCAGEFKKFLTTLDTAAPDDLDVHPVCDNHAIHNTEIVHTLARHPAFHVHFTPTGSSCNNRVETRLRPDHRQAHPPPHALSVAEPEADIRQWIDIWDQNPQPFTWTNAADEILNSLASLAQISDAGH